MTHPFPMFVMTRSNLISVCSVTGPMLSARPAKNATLCMGRLLTPEMWKKLQLTKRKSLYLHLDDTSRRLLSVWCDFTMEL